MPYFKIFTLLFFISTTYIVAQANAQETAEMPPMPTASNNTEQIAGSNSRQKATSSTYIDIIPSTSAAKASAKTFGEPTHPTIMLSPDRSELVKLDRPVKTVIAGNPAHLAVLPGTDQSLVLIGRQPGATHFIALNDKGEIVMQRHVLVAAPKESYLRVRKTCMASEDPEDCSPMDMYYCPDGMCHNILIQASEEETDDSSEDETEESNATQQYSPTNASPE